MTDLYQWCCDYADTLPPAIRPTAEDGRFVSASRQAAGNGWQPSHIARLVAGQSYAKAYNPTLIALMQLERIGSRAPHTRSQPVRHTSGCIVCAPGQDCPTPALPEHRTPTHWTRQRVQLITELGRIHPDDMSEDEREQHMATLIAHQKAQDAHGRLPSE